LSFPRGCAAPPVTGPFAILSVRCRSIAVPRLPLFLSTGVRWTSGSRLGVPPCQAAPDSDAYSSHAASEQVRRSESWHLDGDPTKNTDAREPRPGVSASPEMTYGPPPLDTR